MSKLEDSIKPLRDQILHGTVMAIDPSSGSANSMPGYAIFKTGKLVDSGHIKLHLGQRHKRLYQLRKSLTEEFECPDVLITEKISFIMQNGFGANSMLALQKGIGVVESCFDCPQVYIAPISWRKYIPPNYVKTDEHDAIMLGVAALKVASAGEWQIPDELLKRLAAA